MEPESGFDVSVCTAGSVTTGFSVDLTNCPKPSDLSGEGWDEKDYLLKSSEVTQEAAATTGHHRVPDGDAVERGPGRQKLVL